MGFVPSKKFADGLEIRTYCQSVATRFNLYDGALFHTCVNALSWDESISRWHIGTDRGDDLRARFVIVAMGPINTPKVPRVPGLDDFEGQMFHTARWDYGYTGGNQNEPVLDKLGDKRVAIVGTGASAIQAVPFLGKYAKQLYVLQRTASTVDERHNTPTDPDWIAGLQPGWQRERQMNFHHAAIDGLAPGEPDRICDIWTEINRNLVRAVRGDRMAAGTRGVPQGPGSHGLPCDGAATGPRRRNGGRSQDSGDPEAVVPPHVQAAGVERRCTTRRSTGST